MFCSVCKEAAAVDATISHKNSFTSGNCQYKLESHDNYYWGYCLFVFFLLSIRSVEGYGALIKVFHFNLEESKGHFILGRATKNSSNYWPDWPPSAGVNF